MKGWVGLVGWPIADGLPTLVVTHQLQVERRTGKVHRPETDVLPLCHATNSTCWVVPDKGPLSGCMYVCIPYCTIDYGSSKLAVKDDVLRYWCCYKREPNTENSHHLSPKVLFQNNWRDSQADPCLPGTGHKTVKPVHKWCDWCCGECIAGWVDTPAAMCWYWQCLSAVMSSSLSPARKAAPHLMQRVPRRFAGLFPIKL